MPLAEAQTPQSDRLDLPPTPHEGVAGTSPGVNTSPGCDDDGWIVPPPVTLSCGTRIQLYKDGESLHAAFNAIKHAKRRICLEIYIFADDPTGRAFAELLCAKAKEGVKVFLIYDSFGSICTNRDMFLQMRAAGVRVEEFHPIRPWEGRYSWRPVNRDHRKLLLVDNDIAGMGGLNIGAEYAGSWVVPSSKPSCVAWRDTAVGFVGPSAQYFLQAFAQSWHYVMQGGRIGKAGFIHGLNVSKKKKHSPPPTELGILASVATMDSPLRAGLHRLFSEAKKSIQLTMAYFAPDDDLINTLCRAAQRGVKVQLMLPAQCDVQLLLIAARSFYAKLLDAGVQIYERQGCILHAKTMIIDGRISVVGSTNLDYRSIEYNCELSSVIRNKTFGQQMQGLFENDIHFAKKITNKEWRRRPISDRFIQWAVSRARYLL
jgi:cardiolipin synthase A/B